MPQPGVPRTGGWSHQPQLLVDTSLANFLITGSPTTSYTQGFQIEYTDKNVPIWAAVGYEDGYNSANTNFVDPNEGGPADWGIFARMATGTCRAIAPDYNKLSAMGNKDNLLVIGAGGDITQVGDTTAYLHTVDVQWATTGGLCVYAAYLGDYVDFAGTNDTAYNWAILGQVGYALNDNWEIFARADYTKFDSIFVSPGGDDSICELTLGGTYYLCGNNLKFTVWAISVTSPAVRLWMTRNSVSLPRAIPKSSIASRRSCYCSRSLKDDSQFELI